ncbi:MAG: error-prone DNA polymerase [Betaproteobacteria bacterium]|nr:error-prone DNA polymerase [Betaproteobacteria bacterium]
MPSHQPPQYAELHCLSNFSFLRGASHPEELVERAAALGYTALAITDECSVAGVVRAHLAVRDKKLPIKLLIGTEIRLAGGPTLVLLATSRNGYGNLAALITRGRMASDKGSYLLTRADLDAGIEDCLALWLPAEKGEAGREKGNEKRETPNNQQPFNGEASQLHADLDTARWLAAHFPGRAWIAVELLHAPRDREQLQRLRALSQTTGLPLVAAGDVHMHVRSRRPVQDTLTAIRLSTPIARCGHALFPNAERHLRLRMRLANLYPTELLDETLRIAARCMFSLDELRYEYPNELVPAGTTPAAYLRSLVIAGMRWRYGACNETDNAPPAIRTLIDHELALITELRYEPYFMTVHDIVRFARSQGILCQGRGSAANSAVCYVLGITEVDPSRMSMLFERFMSRERNEPPDIDVDFEHQRREEVIQYLYNKYGRDRAALTATVITYRAKSAVRDIGKALGLDLEQVDRLSKSMAWWDGRQALPERMQEIGFDPESPVMLQLLRLLETLVSFPRHLSQHTGGFVITQGLLTRLVPIENAAMPDRSVIQWDKDDLDALGLLKVDVLALGMLSAIRRSIDLIDDFYTRLAPTTQPDWYRQCRHERLTVADVPPEDPVVYAMIQRADTMGVFQIESRAQMSMLPRLKPNCFFDLVIEVAIVRPGPIQGGMVHPYLRRRNGDEPVSYPSPAVEKVLKRTLGVPIFQEQVMQLAVVAAGFTPGEADQLRRAMAAWRRKGGLEPFERKLIQGMLERGYTQAFAESIYRQILGFGEYGFPESHSASFSLLVYLSAWIKRHEPAAFLAGLLNSQPMGFYAPAQLIQDARRHDVEVRPVDVLVSDWECSLELADASAEKGEGGRGKGAAVRLGLCMVRGLSKVAGERIAHERKRRTSAHPSPFSLLPSPMFQNIGDLATASQLDQADLKALAAAGALRGLTQHRREAYWSVAGIERHPTAMLTASAINETPPPLPAPTEGQELIADYASLGFSLGRHPLALLRDRLQGLSRASDIQTMPQHRLARACGLVTGRQRPDTAAGIVFITLEDETGYVNVVVWPKLLEAQRREILGARLMAVYGVIDRAGDVVHLIAKRVVDQSALLGRLNTRSRDFH